VKPEVGLMGFIGLTAVMPFYKASQYRALESFSATCKADADAIGLAPGLKSRPWSFYIFQRLFWDLRVSVVILESVCLVYN